MYSLYFLPDTIRLIGALTCFIGVGSGCIAVFFSVVRRNTKYKKLKIVVLFSLIFHQTVCYFMLAISQEITNIADILIMPPLLYMNIIPVGILIFLGVKEDWRCFFGAFFLFLSFAPLEGIFHEQYKWLFCLSLVVIGAGLLGYMAILWGEYRKSINAFSIKEAIDTLPDGIGFITSRGKPVLMNIQLEKILLNYYHLKPRRQVYSWKEVVKDGELIHFEEEYYEMTLEEIIVDKSKYLQIAAMNITEEEILNIRIAKENQKLEENENQLKENILNMEAMKREKESLRIKGRAHDAFGERLFILGRLLEEQNQTVNEEYVQILMKSVEGIESELLDNDRESPEVSFASLQEHFRVGGVELILQGKFPRGRVGYTFIKVIREAATNGIKHGNAKEITIDIIQNIDGVKMCITNDGDPPKEKVVKGTGILAMERRIEEIGGKLEISTTPVFILHVTVFRAKCLD